MPIKLQIRKKTGNVWEYYNVDTQVTRSSSQQFMTSDGDYVDFKQPYGNDFGRQVYSDIAVYDDTDTGAEETFTSVSLLAARLKALKNPSFSQECDGDVNGGTP